MEKKPPHPPRKAGNTNAKSQNEETRQTNRQESERVEVEKETVNESLQSTLPSVPVLPACLPARAN